MAGIATVSTAFYLPQYTTTARDAGTFNEGAMIYNTTVKKMEFYDGTNWVTLAWRHSWTWYGGILNPK